MEIEVHPLVPDPVLPTAAPPSTRAEVPQGYGVQEQCLPFTAAASAGLLIRAPFSFGFCDPASVPAAARGFAAPFRSSAHDAAYCFYIQDRPSSRFAGNAFRQRLFPMLIRRESTHLHNAVHPGLSFFDRSDQAAMFKLHLPYVLRTPEGVDSLFLSPINRPGPLQIVSGLVETDWYAHPVNLVAHLPPGPIHVTAGDVVAQVVFVHRSARAARISVVDPSSAPSQVLQHDLLRWYVAHNQDRSAYKKLARSRHGRLDALEDSSEGDSIGAPRGWRIEASAAYPACADRRRRARFVRQSSSRATAKACLAVMVPAAAAGRQSVDRSSCLLPRCSPRWRSGAE